MNITKTDFFMTNFDLEDIKLLQTSINVKKTSGIQKPIGM